MSVEALTFGKLTSVTCTGNAKQALQQALLFTAVWFSTPHLFRAGATMLLSYNLGICVQSNPTFQLNNLLTRLSFPMPMIKSIKNPFHTCE